MSYSSNETRNQNVTTNPVKCSVLLSTSLFNFKYPSVLECSVGKKSIIRPTENKLAFVNNKLALQFTSGMICGPVFDRASSCLGVAYIEEQLHQV